MATTPGSFFHQVTGARVPPSPSPLTPSGRGGLASRRLVLGAGGLLLAGAGPAARPVVRLGVLPFGTVQWIASVITRHRLDEAHGFSLQTVKMANTEAAKVALLGGAVDVAVSDWPFVASQRVHGGHLCMVANSSSLGGIMVPAGSAVRGLADLRGLRLGVAGGAQDKSWLIVRAAAHHSGIDLTRQASLSFGAPPLLGAMLQDRRLDALLTFWNFAARLQADGSREAVTVEACARLLGLAAPVLLGWVFDERWATANRALIGGFLAACLAAEDVLARDPAEWTLVRPLMDAADDDLFADLRRRFLAGLAHPDAATMRAEAAKMLAALAAADGVAGAGTLPQGVFWQGTDAG